MLFSFLALALSVNHGWLWWIGPTLGLASFAFYCWYYYVTGYRKFEDVLQSVAHSLSSFIALFSVIIAIIGQWNPNMQVWAAAFLCVAVPLAIHALMVMLVTNWKRALAFYFLTLVVLYMVPGLGFLGGLTLRYLGIGGAIPVSIRVKAYGRTGTVSGVDEMTGCLVLMTGGDVLIRPTGQILDCKLHPQLMGGQSLRPIATYSRVERYARADVLRVSKFPTFVARWTVCQSVSAHYQWAELSFLKTSDIDRSVGAH